MKMQMKYIITTDRVCANCKYYVQYYTKEGFEVWAGHCPKSELNNRMPLTEACNLFRQLV